jgi:hypothetical protein
MDEDLGVTYTYNHMIQSVDSEADRYCKEMVKMTSSDVSGITEYDLARIRSYSNALRNKVRFFNSEPIRDLVEVKGDKLPLDPMHDLPLMEDRSMYDLCFHLNTFRKELRRSASSRMVEGMNKFDMVRCEANLDRFDNYLEEYVLTTDPIDTPLTSPLHQTTGTGNRQVK